MEQKNAETRQKRRKKRLSLFYILGGGILKEDFIVKHIDRLQQQLRDVRFEALSISSELTGNNRQSQVELLIEEQGIELETAKNPPYELHK